MQKDLEADIDELDITNPNDLTIKTIKWGEHGHTYMTGFYMELRKGRNSKYIGWGDNSHLPLNKQYHVP